MHASHHWNLVFAKSASTSLTRLENMSCGVVEFAGPGKMNIQCSVLNLHVKSTRLFGSSAALALLRRLHAHRDVGRHVFFSNSVCWSQLWTSSSFSYTLHYERWGQRDFLLFKRLWVYLQCYNIIIFVVFLDQCLECFCCLVIYCFI